MTDAELLRGARRGDAEAWRTLHQRYLPVVWRQAYARVSDVHAAEDITSETMLALLRGIERLERLEMDAPRIAGWLRSVVEYKAADHHRKQFRARNHAISLNGAAHGLRESPSPTAPLEADETKTQVLAVLDKLPDRQRTVLEWKYLEALRVREMAERLGDTEKAVEALLYRARREFRRLFELKELRRDAPVCDEPSEIDANSP